MATIEEARRHLERWRREHEDSKIRELMRTNPTHEAVRASIESIRSNQEAIPEEHSKAFILGALNAIVFTVGNRGAGMQLVEQVLEAAKERRGLDTVLFDTLNYIGMGGKMPTADDILSAPPGSDLDNESQIHPPWVVAGFLEGWVALARYLETGEEDQFLLSLMSMLEVKHVRWFKEEA